MENIIKQDHDPIFFSSLFLCCHCLTHKRTRHSKSIWLVPSYYDNGLCGFSIDLGNEFGASLESKIRSYMGTKDWDSYLKEIMTEIELRILDEYLKTKGWL